MDGSDARWVLEALRDVVDGLDRYCTSGRELVRPNIGTLHFMPMPEGQRSIWGVVKRYPDEVEPFYAVFEVEGQAEPTTAQEAHYTAFRRLEAHYLASLSPILLGLTSQLPPTLSPLRSSLSAEDFRTVSVRIPPQPFNGDVWKLRYRHRAVPTCTFELELTFCDVTEAAIYVDKCPTGGAIPALASSLNALRDD